jgi:hypothetical protein
LASVQYSCTQCVQCSTAAHSVFSAVQLHTVSSDNCHHHFTVLKYQIFPNIRRVFVPIHHWKNGVHCIIKNKAEHVLDVYIPEH